MLRGSNGQWTCIKRCYFTHRLPTPEKKHEERSYLAVQLFSSCCTVLLSIAAAFQQLLSGPAVQLSSCSTTVQLLTVYHANSAVVASRTPSFCQGWEFALWFFERIARFCELNSNLLIFLSKMLFRFFLKSDLSESLTVALL